ncbi:hypothetical protein ODU73_000576 [Thermoclostridium stercorarium]|jgi:flagellar motility protein MotE (MotC chaperone)|uniref:Magnesium transporter MgtE intracellular domain-containing protein n=1 Tax=Thermoclostridium stercorarium subsp. leptospartum DSM 9219 TaxID=1346611 RepID=A0A1B1YIF3_THEST|nr:hypothetical protein [Thermoclostridium stercorarium]ANX00559.1 hypothetical protein CSTERLE_02600 [Thermoclostridium stercorarium subsp. leptospartum DSM 9219]UZQ86172.1 hypothetical protein ODU73_000576 [Thermoclostridium stercorarium]
MAEIRALTPRTKKGNGKDAKSAVLDGLLTILVSIVIVLIIFGGTFYYLLKNNIGGLGEYFRPSIERIPVLKHALPPLPESEDPDDPRHLTQRELIEKYDELRRTNKELTKQLEDAQKRINELESEKEKWTSMADEAQEILEKNEGTSKKILEQLEQLETQKKELDRLIAMGNPEGFAEYYEKMNPENARELYQEIVKQQVAEENYRNLAVPYTQMEPENAAAILTELGQKDMELVVNLMETMKNDVKAEIIENMDPKFAAELMKAIADKKISR